MDSVARIGDVLELENDRDYQVVKIFEYEGDVFLLLMRMPEDAVQAFNLDKQPTMFAKEDVDENDNYSIIPISDKASCDILFKALKEYEKANKE